MGPTKRRRHALSPGHRTFEKGAQCRKEEPRLRERIVARAFHTGARVTPVDGSAADNLADADGIAALLRW